MTYEQYWYGDVWMVEAYRNADKLKRQRANEQLWVQGMYVYEAVCDASPLFHDFAKKGTKAVPYRSEPYPLFKEGKSEEQKEQEAENERLKATWFFKNWAKATAKQFKKPEESVTPGKE